MFRIEMKPISEIIRQEDTSSSSNWHRGVVKVPTSDKVMHSPFMVSLFRTPPTMLRKEMKCVSLNLRHIDRSRSSRFGKAVVRESTSMRLIRSLLKFSLLGFSPAMLRKDMKLVSPIL